MVEVQWADEEKDIVLWKFPSRWTWHDFYEAKQEVDAMIDSVEGIVDSIFLTSGAQRMPSGALQNLKRIITERHQRHDLIVVVNTRMFLHALVTTVFKFVPSAKRQFHFVNSEEEAYAIIRAAQQNRLPSAERGAAERSA